MFLVANLKTFQYFFFIYKLNFFLDDQGFDLPITEFITSSAADCVNFYIKSVNFTMILSDRRPAVVKNQLLTMKQPLGYWLIAASHIFIAFSNFHYALILQMCLTNFFNASSNVIF